jgi:cytochrome c oxidase assembly factor CtaG
MTYLTGHWTFDPFLIIAIVLAVWHEAGLARLARRSRPDRTGRRRARSAWFYGGLIVLLLAVESPVDYWADRYFFVHMLQHLLLMFAAPSMIVAGAPWQPLLDGLPGRAGQAVVRQVTTASWSRPLRAVCGFLLRPWPAIIAFSVVMVAWHVPVLLDTGTSNAAIHIWLMHGTFFLAGLLFWLQYISSPPFRIKMKAAGQAAGLMLTNGIMVLTAMSMSILTNASWYSVYDHVPGVTLPAFADQQIGAAILWICGDFWAVPAMIYVVRRMISEDGGIGAAVEKILGKGSRRYQWAGRP